ncbi:MAG: R3H domain-containing nucleic acid-binding protein [Candidatus Paceibacterota bacterium]
MDKTEIQNLIKELIEKTTIKLNGISIVEDGPKNMWVSVEVSEPHFFTTHDGEGLHALNHIVRRIMEAKMYPRSDLGDSPRSDLGVAILIDINGFQKKHRDNIRAVAHMMSERARYFKSNIEVDPMSAFERRIVHEFLSDATDLKTESIGTGYARRVVIKYIGSI